MTKIQNDLDICKADTAEADPDYLVIHSATHTQVSPWDDWAKEVAMPMLAAAQWKPIRLGATLHMVPEFFRGGVA